MFFKETMDFIICVDFWDRWEDPVINKYHLKMFAIEYRCTFQNKYFLEELKNGTFC